MKKLILAAIATTAAASVFAQGTVTFNNRVAATGTTHIWLSPSGPQIQGNGATDIPAGGIAYNGTLLGTTGSGLPLASALFAQLLGAPGSGTAESSLLPGLGITTFRTGAASGNVSPTTSTFANIPQDAPVATFEMVAWDNSSGAYPTWTQASSAWLRGDIAAGRSAPFVLQNIGGLTFTPPNIVSPTAGAGVGSFNIFIIPEPTTVALAGLGAAALLIFRRRK
jgi:hypothetical protein